MALFVEFPAPVGKINLDYVSKYTSSEKEGVFGINVSLGTGPVYFSEFTDEAARDDFLGNLNTGVLASDICIIIMGTSGDWRGHIAGTGSLLTPNAIFEGLDIYEFKWNIVTGEFIISFGETGTDEIANTVQLNIKHPNKPEGNSGVWDEANTDYEFTSLELAQWIQADLRKSCFNVKFQPRLIIHYDFAEVLSE